MRITTKLLSAGAALLLTTGAALAVPATAQTDLNVRSGPGTQYPVVGSLQSGETVDAANCSGSWCQVSFNGGTGYASRNYLALGGAVAPGPAVAVAPYGYDGDDYDDGYYGYDYGPSAYVYANPGFYRYGHRGYGRPGWNGGHWTGRPGRPGGFPPTAGQPRNGFAGAPAGWQRPGTGIGAGRPGGGFAGGGARAGGGFAGGAPAGGGFTGGGAAAPSAPAGGGFAGSIVRGR